MSFQVGESDEGRRCKLIKKANMNLAYQTHNKSNATEESHTSIRKTGMARLHAISAKQHF